MSTILSFFIPGFLGFALFRSVAGIKNMDVSITIAFSGATSFIVLAAIRGLKEQTISTTDPVTIWEFLLSIFICLAIGYGASKIYQMKGVGDFLSEKLNYSPASTTWETLYRYDACNVITIKLEGREGYIRGELSTLGNLPENQWIALSRYQFLNSNNEVEYTCTNSEYRLIVNMNCIEYAIHMPVSSE